MAKKQQMPHKKRLQILELYFNPTDRKLKTISEIVGYSPNAVSLVIQLYFDKKIEFEPDPNIIILHSSINY